MLYQGTFNDPHMEVNGVVKKIAAEYWAEKTLSPEDYERFKEASFRQNQMWSEMLASGKMEMSVVPGETAKKVVLHSMVIHDPEYVKYMRQMLKDPAVTWPGPGIKPIY